MELLPPARGRCAPSLPWRPHAHRPRRTHPSLNLTTASACTGSSSRLSLLKHASPFYSCPWWPRFLGRCPILVLSISSSAYPFPSPTWPLPHHSTQTTPFNVTSDLCVTQFFFIPPLGSIRLLRWLPRESSLFPFLLVSPL